MSAAEHQDVEHVATVTHLPHLAPSVEPPAVVEPAEPRDPILPRLAAYLTPPDVWSEKRPSLHDLWSYGVRGEWTRVDGLVRFAGACWATLALALHAVLYVVGWIFERPARFFVAATVAALVYLAF